MQRTIFESLEKYDLMRAAEIDDRINRVTRTTVTLDERQKC